MDVLEQLVAIKKVTFSKFFCDGANVGVVQQDAFQLPNEQWLLNFKLNFYCCMSLILCFWSFSVTHLKNVRIWHRSICHFGKKIWMNHRVMSESLTVKIKYVYVVFLIVYNNETINDNWDTILFHAPWKVMTHFLQL